MEAVDEVTRQSSLKASVVRLYVSGMCGRLGALGFACSLWQKRPRKSFSFKPSTLESPAVFAAWTLSLPTACRTS